MKPGYCAADIAQKEKVGSASYLIIELPRFDVPVVYSEATEDRPNLFSAAKPILDPEILFPDNLVRYL